MGGLSKKAYQIKTVREHQNGPLLVLDAGNLLFKRSSNPPGDSQQKITAAGIINAYTKMGYDAVAVGPLDLAAGTDFLKNQGNPHFPWISANLLNTDNKLEFPPFIIKKTGQTKTGIIGLSNVVSPLTGLHTSDWHAILPAQLQKLSKKCNHIILLSNLPQNDNYEIAQHYPNLQIIISADEQLGALPPNIINKSLITQTAQQGKYLGRLDITWGNNGNWQSALEKEFDLLSTTLDSINQQINALQQESTFSPDINTRYEMLKNEKQNIAQQMSALKDKLPESVREGARPSSFSTRFIAFGSSLPESTEINEIILEIKQKISRLNTHSK